jgi:hypothetical protein
VTRIFARAVDFSHENLYRTPTDLGEVLFDGGKIQKPSHLGIVVAGNRQIPGHP